MKTGVIQMGMVLGLLASCAGQPEGPGVVPGGVSLQGTWRAVLASPGGELPFTLRIEPPGRTVPAVAINGHEEVPFSSLTWRGEEVILRIDGYDSQITARLSDKGQVLKGEWTKTIPEGRSRLPFTARKGQQERFALPPVASAGAAAAEKGGEPVPVSIQGDWSVLFHDDEGDAPARGEFTQQDARVTGTFLTPTGDYRYLEGDYRQGFLRLSCFDGGHVFLFHGRWGQDGVLRGDFWSRDRYHATWRAKRAEAAGDGLPDPFELVFSTREDQRLPFRFPDVEGRLVSLSDPEYRGQVVLVNLFGTWCPNCNDEAPLLAEWDHRYRSQGLRILGLAYEFTGRPGRDRLFVEKYARKYGIEFPLLLAGVSDKTAASRTLPGLSRVLAFPTTIFVDRKGRIRRIYSGFSGPATGRHHAELVMQFQHLIEELLAEGGVEPASS